MNGSVPETTFFCAGWGAAGVYPDQATSEMASSLNFIPRG